MSQMGGAVYHPPPPGSSWGWKSCTSSWVHDSWRLECPHTAKRTSCHPWRRAGGTYCCCWPGCPAWPPHSLLFDTAWWKSRWTNLSLVATSGPCSALSSSVNLGISVSFLTVNYTVDPSGSLQARARQGQIFFHLSDKKTWKDIRENIKNWKEIKENYSFSRNS